MLKLIVTHTDMISYFLNKKIKHNQPNEIKIKKIISSTRHGQ